MIFPGYRPSVKTLSPTERRFYMTFLWDLPVVNGQHKLVCTMKYGPNKFLLSQFVVAPIQIGEIIRTITEREEKAFLWQN